jgi:hypothetical protein
MQKSTHIETLESPYFFAKMVVGLELRRTHGVEFASAFLAEFGYEIIAAAVINYVGVSQVHATNTEAWETNWTMNFRRQN